MVVLVSVGTSVFVVSNGSKGGLEKWLQVGGTTRWLDSDEI